MKSIALIGPRGVGKSKVSRKLSKLIGLPYIATDMIAVYEQGGISIPEMVQKNLGDWRPFRTLEKNILLKLQTANNIILDCGGGILFDVDEKGKEFYSEEKVSLLRNIAIVILLLQDKDKLVQKVHGDASRPNLSAVQSYSDILDRRIPFYKKASDHILFIDEIEPEEVAQKLAERLNLKTIEGK